MTLCGSGTTIISAEQTGRKARAVEIEPRYVDIAVRRYAIWCQKNGREAVVRRNGEAVDIATIMADHAEGSC